MSDMVHCCDSAFDAHDIKSMEQSVVSAMPDLHGHVDLPDLLEDAISLDLPPVVAYARYVLSASLLLYTTPSSKLVEVCVFYARRMCGQRGELGAGLADCFVATHRALHVPPNSRMWTKCGVHARHATEAEATAWSCVPRRASNLV